METALTEEPLVPCPCQAAENAGCKTLGLGCLSLQDPSPACLKTPTVEVGHRVSSGYLQDNFSVKWRGKALSHTLRSGQLNSSWVYKNWLNWIFSPRLGFTPEGTGGFHWSLDCRLLWQCELLKNLLLKEKETSRCMLFWIKAQYIP